MIQVIQETNLRFLIFSQQILNTYRTLPMDQLKVIFDQYDVILLDEMSI